MINRLMKIIAIKCSNRNVLNAHNVTVTLQQKEFNHNSHFCIALHHKGLMAISTSLIFTKNNAQSNTLTSKFINISKCSSET